ncbi:MAG: beta-propeller fold lactonase family protein [Pontiellaceae bacterium]|nr:beta-propeller fold lactonase family protein [Pontiellaceae bacterium]MBN2786502.1 beta-propeller fold lactonase family protein [Pontiellaceae bacterium]
MAIDDGVGLRDGQVYEAAAQPHAVLVNSCNDVLYVTCMGGDRILQYRFTPESGMESAVRKVVTDEGTGPRHFVFCGKTIDCLW